MASEAKAAGGFDHPWKELLDHFFRFFMAFFFPKAHNEIDWTRPIRFLDNEFRMLAEKSRLRARIVDKLAKVRRKGGGETLVLIHIEIQGRRERDFGARMYRYHSLIHKRYGIPVMSAAVLCDASPGWKPDRFEYTIWDCGLRFYYPAIKLLEYKERWDELEASANPFAIAVMAHLKAMDTRGDARRRAYWKYELTRRLLGKHFGRDEITRFFRLIDGVMRMPDAFEREFNERLEACLEGKGKPYLVPYEQRALKKLKEGLRQGLKEGRQQGKKQGLQQGLQQGRQEGLKKGRQEGRQEGIRLELIGSIADILKARFKWKIADSKKRLEPVADARLLRQLRKKALSAKSGDEFLAELRRCGKTDKNGRNGS